MQLAASALLLTSLISTGVNAFYLPGAAPHDFQEGERVELFVNALTPIIGSTDNAKLVRRPPSRNPRSSHHLLAYLEIID